MLMFLETTGWFVLKTQFFVGGVNLWLVNYSRNDN